MRCLLVVIFLFPWSLPAATLNVATTGDDTIGDGSSATPYRTIVKAESVAVSGDIVNIWGGDFDEYLQIAGVLGVRFQSLSNATVRALRVDTASNTLSGIKIDKAADADYRSWDAFVYINSDAHFTTITNCQIVNQPWLSATNWSINPSGAGTNTISSPSVDFVAAGFKVGGRVYINGVSYKTNTRGAEFRFVNQGRAVIPTNVTTTSLTFSNGVLLAETNPSVWAVISSGSDYNFKGVVFTPSGGGGASNCVITSCLFSNMVGQPIVLNGHDNVVTNCEFTACYGNSFINHSGYNLSVVSNYFHHCPLPAYYSILETVDHTGGNFYDYYVRTIIGSSLQTINTNFLYHGNWMEDIDNASLGIQHVVVGDEADFHTYSVIGNVFIGVAGELDGGQNNMRIQSNTFYRCSYQEGHSAPVTIGGEAGTYTNNTLYFTHNLMVANGDHSDLTDEGFPSIVVTTGIVSSNNYVCGPEVSRWNPMPAYGATNGINGGDPMFVNEFNPRGPDGIPFTADDGLRLHPRSPAIGIGALPVATTVNAFFRPVNVSSNFLDATGTNFNLPWHTNLYAFQRTSWDRDYDYGDALFNLPMKVAFTATNTISATKSTNGWIGIDWFLWDFGDGSRPLLSRWPDITHTFLRTGAVTVTLTVTNSAGNSSAHTRNYRIMPISDFTNRVLYVSTNGNNSNSGLTEALAFLTVSNAVRVAGPGDFVAVLPGFYDEFVNMGDMSPSNGTHLLPITVASYGARLFCLSQRRHWWTWEGFEFSLTNVPNLMAAPINIFANGSDVTTNCTFAYNYYHDSATNISFINCATLGSGIFHRGISALNNTIIHTVSAVFFITASNVLVGSNICIEVAGEADFISGDGVDYKVVGNYVRDIGYTNNNHSDFIQGAFGAYPSRDWLVEKNWLELTRTNIQAQVTSMGNTNYPHNGSYSNVVFRNNVVIFFYGGLSPIGLDGPKVYNNLFAWSGHGTSHSIVYGGQGGDLLGIDIRNNIFFGCGQGGTDTGKGWYENGSTATNSTVTIADRNYVSGSNFTAKVTAPPNDSFHWAITGQEVNGVNGGDPKFTDSAIYDFRLAANSPLINAGTVLSEFTTDFWGRERGSTWDIGPFDSLTEASGATNHITTRLR